MTTDDRSSVAMCHVCGRRPVGVEQDKQKAPQPPRLEALARDESPAIAHVAGAALAHQHDAEAWDRVARAVVESGGEPPQLQTAQKWAVVSREVAAQLHIVAQDAKAVSES